MEARVERGDDGFGKGSGETTRKEVFLGVTCQNQLSCIVEEELTSWPE
jgi:hypothetical protein